MNFGYAVKQVSKKCFQPTYAAGTMRPSLAMLPIILVISLISTAVRLNN